VTFPVDFKHRISLSYRRDSFETFQAIERYCFNRFLSRLKMCMRDNRSRTAGLMVIILTSSSDGPVRPLVAYPTRSGNIFVAGRGQISPYGSHAHRPPRESAPQMREVERKSVPTIFRPANDQQILASPLTQQDKGDDQLDWVFESPLVFDEGKLDLDRLELSIESLFDEIFDRQFN
jgi:hypothetical protein